MRSKVIWAALAAASLIAGCNGMTPSTPTATATPSPQPTATATATLEPTPTLDPSIPPACTEIGQRWINPIDGGEMVCVPAGEFWMGATEGDAEAWDREKPGRRVSLDAYWIDRYEVTVAQFADFVQSTGFITDSEKAGGTYTRAFSSYALMTSAYWHFPKSHDTAGWQELPVIFVSWNDAAAYCQWAGEGLPTEAQWEKAARGSDGRLYPWGNSLPDGSNANFADVTQGVTWSDLSVNDGYSGVAPVGSYPAGASPYGAEDMAGNVAEWTADWYSETYYQGAPSENPTGPENGEDRVLRGGSYVVPAENLRTSMRDFNDVDVNHGNASQYDGFRCSLLPE